jgi:hypothetical protein
MLLLQKICFIISKQFLVIKFIVPSESAPQELSNKWTYQKVLMT